MTSPSSSSTSWVKTIKSPFRKAKTFFNHQNQAAAARDHKRNKSNHRGGEDDKRMMDLQLEGEVMACTYEDVQVMWSILDKSKPRICDVNS